MNTGRVVAVLGKEVLVESDGVLHRASLAGRMRLHAKEAPVVGDVVHLHLGPRGACRVTTIEPRRTVFTRQGHRGLAEPVVANVDLLVVVMATACPSFSLPVLDRFLVLGEMGGLRCAVCLNKIDLPDSPPPELACYPPLGYPVVRTSAITRAGLDELRALVGSSICAFVGPSGTGKSSLANLLVGAHAQKVREVSMKSGRGRHTTTCSRLLPLNGGYLTDTPGIGWLGLPPTDPATLASLFPELRRLQGQCRFTDCSHLVEPGCAVKEAVASGAVAPHRYASYTLMATAGAPGEPLPPRRPMKRGRTGRRS